MWDDVHEVNTDLCMFTRPAHLVCDVREADTACMDVHEANTACVDVHEAYTACMCCSLGRHRLYVMFMSENIFLEDCSGEFLSADDFSVNSYIAIYSHSAANEVFYLCLVNGIKIAVENLVDEIEHTKGELYLSCCYLEKDDSKSTKKFIQYKLINKTVYIKTREVFYPSVPIERGQKLDIDEYIFLSDCV